jgi:hypothetical protein
MSSLAEAAAANSPDLPGISYTLGSNRLWSLAECHDEALREVELLSTCQPSRETFRLAALLLRAHEPNGTLLAPLGGIGARIARGGPTCSGPRSKSC